MKELIFISCIIKNIKSKFLGWWTDDNDDFIVQQNFCEDTTCIMSFAPSWVIGRYSPILFMNSKAPFTQKMFLPSEISRCKKHSTVRPRKKEISWNQVNFSENCNDLSEKVYIVTGIQFILFLLTPVTRCIGHAWPSTIPLIKRWCRNWFAQNRNLGA